MSSNRALDTLPDLSTVFVERRTLEFIKQEAGSVEAFMFASIEATAAFLCSRLFPSPEVELEATKTSDVVIYNAELLKQKAQALTALANRDLTHSAGDDGHGAVIDCRPHRAPKGSRRYRTVERKGPNK